MKVEELAGKRVVRNLGTSNGGIETSLRKKKVSKHFLTSHRVPNSSENKTFEC